MEKLDITIKTLRQRAQEEHVLISTFIREIKNFQKDLFKRESELIEKFADIPQKKDKDFSLNLLLEGSDQKLNLDSKTTELLIDAIEKKIKMTSKYETLLHVMTFTYSSAIFDALLLDFLRSLLTQNENILKSNKTLTIQTILEQNDIESLKELILNKELLEFGYKSFRDQLKYLSDKFNFDLKIVQDLFEDINEIIETRNIHVHNKGMINNIYLNNVKNTKFQLGDYREIDEEYLEKSRNELNDAINYLFVEGLRKFDC